MPTPLPAFTRLLFRDEPAAALSAWQLEGDATAARAPATATTPGGIRVILESRPYNPCCTLWLKQPAPADFQFTYRATFEAGDGWNILFFCAADSAGGDFLTWPRPLAAWADYTHSGRFRMYSVSYSRYDTTGSNIRKMLGRPAPADELACPILSSGPDPCQQLQRPFTFCLTKHGRRIHFTIDDQVIHDWTDTAPPGEPWGVGRLGLRTFCRPKTVKYDCIELRGP